MSVELAPTPAMSQDYMALIDRAEAAMVANFAPVECPVTHVFIPGLYIRTIFMPKGAIITSKIHLTEHRYAVLHGEVAVRTENETVILKGGDQGITMPGTRRALSIIEDTIWSTFHPITEDEMNDVEKIESRIIMKHGNKLLKEATKCLG
jgi:quercetin dioxygenase-like cupin family protein